MKHCVLLAAGSNAKGQLGIGSYDDAHTFTPCRFAGCESDRLPEDAEVMQVACGANHSVVLMKGGEVWGAGEGGSGQLGVGYPRQEQGEEGPWTRFHKLDLGDAARGYRRRSVAAAWETTYVVLGCDAGSESGSDVVLAMGSGAFGALGGGEEGGGTPRIVDLERVVVAEEDWGKKRLRVRGLYAGPRHVVAEVVLSPTDSDSDSDSDSAQTDTVLIGWGASRHGQLGPHAGRSVPPTRLPIDVPTDPMVACALGNQHTVVLHSSGRLSALGSNKQGQLSASSTGRVCGLGCTWNGTYVQAIEGDRRVLLSRGNNAQGQLGRDTAGSGPVCLPTDRVLSRFVCGSEHVLAILSRSLREDNSVVGWGWNEHGNMGLGSVGNVVVPTQVWPREEVEAYNKYPQRVMDIWAGCATSWLLVE